jgi:hypothetical protein
VEVVLVEEALLQEIILEILEDLVVEELFWFWRWNRKYTFCKSTSRKCWRKWMC